MRRAWRLQQQADEATKEMNRYGRIRDYYNRQEEATASRSCSPAPKRAKPNTPTVIYLTRSKAFGVRNPCVATRATMSNSIDDSATRRFNDSECQ